MSSIFFSLKTVLKNKKYLSLFLFLFFLILTLSIFIPNLALFKSVLFSSTIDLVDKLKLFLTFYASLFTNFTLVSATYTVLISILFGLNLSLLIYYVKQRQGRIVSIKGNGATGIVGVFSGVLGIGCASCGTFILTTLLSLFGVAGIIAWLPFDGEEFGFIGAGLLLYSVYSLLKKISMPLVCV